MCEINRVIAGDYVGKMVAFIENKIRFCANLYSKSSIVATVDKNTVESYEVVDEFSGMKNGFLGSKGVSEYIVSLNFKNGEKSLILIDRNFYVELFAAMY